MKKYLLGLLAGCVGFQALAQDSDEIFQLNTITTAVPFLLISPDSRAGGMGDAGVATSADANSIHWNPAKLGFVTNDLEININYTPWLKKLVKDINLAYLSAYKRIDKNSAAAVAMRYFSLGNITFTDQYANVIRDFKPNEFSFDLGYGRILGKNFSGGMAARYIYSNLTGGIPVSGANTKPGMSGAVDIGLMYSNDEVKIGGKDATISVGMNVSNVGAKISYTNTTKGGTAQRDFLPTNLRIGGAGELRPDQYNKFVLALDFNKLLVPTPPLYSPDNPNEIFSGRDRRDLGVAAGIFGSFTDAPGYFVVNSSGSPEKNANGEYEIEKGSRFKEELREINISTGAEWWYANQFAARLGYFHEHPTKGNRQYLTLGAGLKYSKFGLDVSYLISIKQNNPLAGTLRFSLKFIFEKLKSKTDSSLESGS